MVINFQSIELNVQHHKKTSKEIVLNIIQYIALFATMILMGGHENTHPHTEKRILTTTYNKVMTY